MQEGTSSPVSATAVCSNAQVKSGGVSAADVQNPIANLVSLPLLRQPIASLILERYVAPQEGTLGPEHVVAPAIAVEAPRRATA